MDKNINANGYDYVDLGLPSGTLWSTMNVGASKPSEAGLYFQFGDTVGYTKEQVGKGKRFYWTDYKFSINRSSSNFSKYTKEGETLELEDDAAHVNMGGSWHMPSPKQIKELLDNTTTAWTTQDGVNGRLFTSKKDGSKSIFIPAAGGAWDGSVLDSGGYGGVWSSLLSTDYASDGQNLDFDSGNVSLNYSLRCGGLSVRGVIDKKCDDSNRKKRNMEAKEKLNLVDILKDAPKETKLWSPLYGECELKYVNIKASNYPIKCTTKDHQGDTTYVMFTANGKYSNNFYYSECMLFPSKDNRDWSTFKAPKKHKSFKPFQKVLVKYWINSRSREWFSTLYGHYDASKNIHFLSNFAWVEDDGIIPYEGNEDKLGKPVER